MLEKFEQFKIETPELVSGGRRRIIEGYSTEDDSTEDNSTEDDSVEG